MKRVMILFLALCLWASSAARAENALPVLRLDAEMLNYVTARPGTLTLGDFSTPVTVKYRGTYSVTFTGKRNYSLHLKDADGAQRKEALLGLRADDDYVLLGGLSDGSRLRNPVGLSLWRSLGYPAPAAAACELYFGDYYKGIYFLTERPDRKSAGVPRDGALYRVLAAGVDGVNLFSAEDPGAPETDTWYNVGKVYPEGEGGWEPLAALLAAEDRADMLDAAAFADYYLYINLIGATDNVEKNLYLCWNGRAFSPMPWDLDAAFGRLYNGELSDPAAWYGGDFYDKLVRTEDFDALLRSRWAALRENLTPGRVMALFQRWYDALEQAGAWVRERERFPMYTDHTTGREHPLEPEAELNLIREYLNARYALLEAAYTQPEEQEP